MSHYNKILVALDWSGPSESAAAEAVALGRALGAEIAFLNVIETRYMSLAPTNVVETFEVQEDRLRKVAEDRMKELVSKIEGAGNVTIKLRVGVPSDEILKEVAEWDADLLIVGTHGRRGLERVVLGSQAEAMMRRSPVPMLVVHEDKHEEPQPS